MYTINELKEWIKQERNLIQPEWGNWRGYTQGLLLVVLATILGRLLLNLFSPANMVMFYLICVTVTAISWGLVPSILVSLLSVLAFDFFLIPPYFTFTVADTQYIFTFIVLFLVGIVISYLTTRVRQQTEIARHREREVTALYALGRDLVGLSNLESYVHAIIKRVKETLSHDVVIFLPENNTKGSFQTYTDSSGITIGKNELSVARWTFQNKKPAGFNTDTFPDAKAWYLPLVTARGSIGVIALWSTASTDKVTEEQERLMEAYTDLTAVAIEGIRLADELHDTQVLKATEKLQTALLNAISHDLRTPLVSIIGALSSLQEEEMNLNTIVKENLIQVACDEADRLNHLITNLLDESRIEAGAITLSRQPSEIHDLIGAALEQLGNRSRTRNININIPAEIPFISVDFGLIVQTFVNIMDNAIKYSSPDSLIEINVHYIAPEVIVEIIDRGIGVPEQDLQHIFDKFYRIKRPDNVGGTGLGLSISKGIIEAHNGHIEAKNRPGGGTIISITLPVVETKPYNVEKSNEQS